MPKKTKKEKLLAARHRSTLPPVAAKPAPQLRDAPSPFQFSLPQKKSTVAKHQATVAVEDFSAIKRDLAKTLIITIGIIVGELLLARYLLH